MARPSTPAQRASASKKNVAAVRRKYKVNTRTKKVLLPGEEQALVFTCVVLKLAGYTNIQASKIVGVSRGQVKTFLDTPHAQQLLVELRQRLPQAALELLHGYMIEAVQAMVDVMRRSSDDKMVLQAAAEILDRGGIPKSSRQEKKVEEIQNFTVTDGGILETLREASPEVQEQAAQLVEQLEAVLTAYAEGESEDTKEADAESS
jgi:hypothetical protein